MFLREEGFGSINSRRRVGRPKKRDIHKQTSVAPISHISPSNSIHSSLFCQINPTSISTKRIIRRSSRKSGNPIPMPAISPVDEVHVSSSPREPQTLRSFMNEYKKKGKHKMSEPVIEEDPTLAK